MERILFKDWAEEWLQKKKRFVKESTYANYSILMQNHIILAFSDEIPEKISTEKIQAAVLQWLERGRLNNKGSLARKTVKDMVVILKMCLKDYELSKNQEIRIYSINFPREYYKTEKKDVLTEGEYRNFLMIIQKNLNYETLGYAICLYTGIRIGELCALKWKDINLKERIIRIDKTIQRIYLKNGNKGTTKIVITLPKSSKSIRRIPIANQLYQLLHFFQKKNTDTYVLTGKEKYIEPRLYRTHYNKFLEQHNLPLIRFHGLRHTFATRCIEAGADYKIVSELLGHASVNTTLNLYVHPQMEEKRRCVELL